MRVLIYSETKEAEAEQRRQGAKGHHASLRNPQYFDANVEKCDLAVIDLSAKNADEWLEAYKGKDIKTHTIESSKKAAPVEEDAEPVKGEANIESVKADEPVIETADLSTKQSGKRVKPVGAHV